MFIGAENQLCPFLMHDFVDINGVEGIVYYFENVYFFFKFTRLMLLIIC